MLDSLINLLQSLFGVLGEVRFDGLMNKIIDMVLEAFGV